MTLTHLTAEQINSADAKQLREWFPEPKCPYCDAPGVWREERPGIQSAGIDYECGMIWDESVKSDWHSPFPTTGCIKRLKAETKRVRERAAAVQGPLLDYVQMIQDGNGIDEMLRDEAKALLDRLGMVGRHHYYPDWEAMGDCVECGNIEGADIHKVREGRR